MHVPPHDGNRVEHRSVRRFEMVEPGNEVVQPAVVVPRRAKHDCVEARPVNLSIPGDAFGGHAPFQ